MKKLMVFVFVASLLSMGFAFAQSEDGAEMYAVDAAYPQVEQISIALISPTTGQSFETGSTLNVEFQFSISPYSPRSADTTIVQQTVTCSVELSGVNDLIIPATLNDDGTGSAQQSLSVGNYNWRVICNNGSEWTSEQRAFNINQEPSNNNNNNGNGGGNGGSSNDDESNGRRAANSLPLEELSTTPTTDSEENSEYSGITGAVIGALKNNALGIGIVVVIVGVLALLVYNRQRFGLVKAQ